MPKLRYRYILIKYDLPFSSLGQCQMYVFPNWHVDGLTMMIWVTRHILTCRQNSLPSCMCWVISNNLWVSTSRIFGCLVFTRTAYSAKKSSADKLAKHITVRIRVPQRLCKYYRDEYYLLSFFGGYYGRKLHKYRLCQLQYLF